MAAKQQKILLTKDGFKKLTKELAMREGELREKLQETLNQMRSQGDLKENDGYTMAVEDFQNNEEKILELKETLDNVEIVERKKTSTIDIGCKVTIECEGGQLKTFYIVGQQESNPLESKISNVSPIGSSLMGKKKGMKIKIETPAGSTNCKVVSVE